MTASDPPVDSSTGQRRLLLDHYAARIAKMGQQYDDDRSIARALYRMRLAAIEAARDADLAALEEGTLCAPTSSPR